MIVAQKRIVYSIKISYLCGTAAFVDKDEIAVLKQNRRNFSIMELSRNGLNSGILRPLRPLNHSYKLNARLNPSGTMITAIKDIEPG